MYILIRNKSNNKLGQNCSKETQNTWDFRIDHNVCNIISIMYRTQNTWGCSGSTKWPELIWHKVKN